MKNYSKMNGIASLFFMLFICFSGLTQNSEKAKRLLNEVSTTMNAYKDIYISFDYIFENKDGGVAEEISEGDAILKGDKYVVNIFGITRIFDGSNTFTIIHENEEVNITSSEEDNPVLLTPSELINFHKSGYTYQLGKQETLNGKKIQFVNLTPIDSESEIALVKIGVDINNKHIANVKHIGKNSSETTINIKKIEVNKNLVDSLFSFNEKEFEQKKYTINR